MDNILDRTYKANKQKKYTILYVDDEEVNTRIFERTFKREYNVFVANSGAEGIKILEENKVDLIMTDQRMPKMTGVELLIQVVPLYPNIVRMIMTGFSDEQEIMRVDDEVGLDRFLVKPWNKDELHQEFERALELRNAGKQPAAAENQDAADDSEGEIDFLGATQSLVEDAQEGIADMAYDMDDVAQDDEEYDDDEDFDFDESLLEELPVPAKKEDEDEEISYSVNLLEALLPNQQELKLYVEDGFIVYDHYKPDTNGYWFGESDSKLLIASFNSEAPLKKSLALNVFISSCLTELIYKDRLSSPIEIISNLSKTINHRFFNTNSFNRGCAVDFGVLAYDDENEKIEFCGANHDLYYFSHGGAFQSLKGAKHPIMPGMGLEYETQSVNAGDAAELYFVPGNVILKTNPNSGEGAGVLTTKLLLEEIHKKPMSMQSKLLKDYKYSSIIGMKF